MYDDKFIIEQIKNVAFKSLEVFLERINLDINLFVHLKVVNVILDNIDSLAEYSLKTNTIIISRNIVNSTYKKYCKGKLSFDNFIDTIAVSYLHELLHANRTILIANTLSLYNYKEVIYINNYNKAFKEDLKKYRQSLNIILNSYNYKKFKKYIPILISFNKNNLYNVVAYNKSIKAFEIFNNCLFDSTIENSKDKFLYNISLEMCLKNIIPDQVIYDYRNFDVISALPTDYKLNNRYYEFDNNIHYKKLVKSLKKQNALEEILTEAFALIMVLTYDEESINYDWVFNNSVLDENDKIGITLIKEFDEETVRWFFLSAYDEVYFDKFKNIFQEKYNDVLNIMYKIYELEKSVTKKDIKDIKIIIKDKLKSKSK